MGGREVAPHDLPADGQPLFQRNGGPPAIGQLDEDALILASQSAPEEGAADLEWEVQKREAGDDRGNLGAGRKKTLKP